MPSWVIGSGIDRAVAAFEEYRSTGARLSEPYFMGVLAQAHLASGRATEAAELLRDAVSLMETGSRRFFGAPDLHRLAAVALVASGTARRDPEVLRHLDAAITSARDLGSPTLELRALLAATQLCDDHAAATDLRRQIARVLDRLEGGHHSTDVSLARALLGT
jgi:hypothetical protein